MFTKYICGYSFLLVEDTEMNACPDKIQRKTLTASIFGPLAVILNVALKCEQTALSQELSMVNKLLFIYILS